MMQNHLWPWTVLPWPVKFKALNLRSGFGRCQGLSETSSCVALRYAESRSLAADTEDQGLGSLPGHSTSCVLEADS